MSPGRGVRRVSRRSSHVLSRHRDLPAGDQRGGHDARATVRGAALPRPRRVDRAAAPAWRRFTPALAGRSTSRWFPARRCPGYPGVRLGWPARRLLRASVDDAASGGRVRGDAGPARLGGGAHRPAPAASRCSAASTRTSRTTRATTARGGSAAAIGADLRRLHNRTAGTLSSRAPICWRSSAAAGFENLTAPRSRRRQPALQPGPSPASSYGRGGAPGATTSSPCTSGRIAPEKNVGLAIDAYRAMRRAGLARAPGRRGRRAAREAPSRRRTPTSCSAAPRRASRWPRTTRRPTSSSSRARPRPSGTWSWRRWRVDSRSSRTTTRRPGRTSGPATRERSSRTREAGAFVAAAVAAGAESGARGVDARRERARRPSRLDWEAVVDAVRDIPRAVATSRAREPVPGDVAVLDREPRRGVSCVA